MTYLPDVNVWIALAAERHTLHRAARNWFSNFQDEKLAFCRLTQLGFLRLLTNKHVMQEEVMSPASDNTESHQCLLFAWNGSGANCPSEPRWYTRGTFSHTLTSTSPRVQ